MWGLNSSTRPYRIAMTRNTTTLSRTRAVVTGVQGTSWRSPSSKRTAGGTSGQVVGGRIDPGLAGAWPGSTAASAGDSTERGASVTVYSPWDSWGTLDGSRLKGKAQVTDFSGFWRSVRAFDP